MSKKRRFKTLSGAEVVRILARFRFAVVHQRGSHVKLQRVLPDGTKQSLAIPNHKAIARGTVAAIYNQASRYVDLLDLDTYFRVGK